jgi:hypothetical protein
VPNVEQCDVEQGVESMAKYLTSCRGDLLEEAMDNLADDVLKPSIHEALRYAEKFPVRITDDGPQSR